MLAAVCSSCTYGFTSLQLSQEKPINIQQSELVEKWQTGDTMQLLGTNYSVMLQRRKAFRLVVKMLQNQLSVDGNIQKLPEDHHCFNSLLICYNRTMFQAEKQSPY